MLTMHDVPCLTLTKWHKCGDSQNTSQIFISISYFTSCKMQQHATTQPFFVFFFLWCSAVHSIYSTAAQYNHKYQLLATAQLHWRNQGHLISINHMVLFQIWDTFQSITVHRIFLQCIVPCLPITQGSQGSEARVYRGGSSSSILLATKPPGTSAGGASLSIPSRRRAILSFLSETKGRG